MTLEKLKLKLNEEYANELPLVFLSSAIHDKKDQSKQFICVENYQTNKFEKFETNQIGYHKPISKSINYLK